jgi:hypothetical protein
VALAGDLIVQTQANTGAGFHKMGIATSSHWTFTLEFEDASFKLASQTQAMRLACEAASGTLSATGDRGDCVEMQYDALHALVLYMPASRPILRPHFPNRVNSGACIEEFFCACCGVQLGNKTEMLRYCPSREEGIHVSARFLAVYFLISFRTIS